MVTLASSVPPLLWRLWREAGFHSGGVVRGDRSGLRAGEVPAILTPRCQAVQQSDEMYCAMCGLRWDVNDSDPPKCRVAR